jgi:hypothetical protein
MFPSKHESRLIRGGFCTAARYGAASIFIPLSGAVLAVVSVPTVAMRDCSAKAKMEDLRLRAEIVCQCRLLQGGR